jgi:ribosome-associated protein
VEVDETLMKAMKARELAMQAMEAALEKKALEPVLLEVSGQSSYTDYILLLSGRSDRHVQAVADAVHESLKNAGARPLGIEGKKDGQWTLLDFGDVVVHVFYHPVREFYDLEGLWVDAPRVPIDVPADARLQVTDAYSL